MCLKTLNICAVWLTKKGLEDAIDFSLNTHPGPHFSARITWSVLVKYLFTLWAPPSPEGLNHPQRGGACLFKQELVVQPCPQANRALGLPGSCSSLSKQNTRQYLSLLSFDASTGRCELGTAAVRSGS